MMSVKYARRARARVTAGASSAFGAFAAAFAFGAGFFAGLGAGFFAFAAAFFGLAAAFALRAAAFTGFASRLTEEVREKQRTIDRLALALRLSYAGELGWEIYAPIEYGLRLWDLLWEAGKPCGLVAGGAGAFDSLRLEKGYRLRGSDIHSEYNPFEAGLGWAVRLNKGYFLGRDALIHAKEKVTCKLCCLTLDEPDAIALGKEPLLIDGETVGYVTSANYGYSVGQYIVYGYLPARHAQPGTKVQVQYFGRRQWATVREEPLFDPGNARMKA